MNKPTALQRIIADNDPRNGSTVQRLRRMLEHPERNPDENGLYNEEHGPRPRDLTCECGYEWTEYIHLLEANPACPVCSSEVVVRV